jgi:predicted nucleic acid-binding protein
MNFASIPSGTEVFVDTNTLVYHFIAYATFGAACTDLLERIERHDLQGFTSSHVLGEMAHRLMTVEACLRFNWPSKGIARRLRNHPAEIQKLTQHYQAIDDLSLIRMQVLSVTGHLVSLAADTSRRHGLLMNDALIATVMRDRGLSHFASNDGDLDRIPGIVRYSPV